MLLPIAWLKQFVSVNETTEQVAQRFVELGFEAELKNESIIDLDITPNRGDVLSILGLAREYAASTNQSVTMPKTAELGESQELPGVTIEGEPSAYHRFSAIVIHDVTVESSPDWLRQAVIDAGMNSINTIVDLTNYVMIELGIPLHAFDLDQLPDSTLKIRLSREGESYTSLKDEKFTLAAHLPVVECGNELIDLVGIRGGKRGMITADTKNILIWGLSLPRPLIRNAVKKTGLRTDGAYRHERETDWLMTETSMARIAELYQQLGCGAISPIVTREASPVVLPVIAWDRALVNQLLGTNYTDQSIDTALTRLGFIVSGNQVTVPSWRMFDVTLPEDLVEEVARIEGYSALPHAVIAKSTPPTETIWAKIENLKDTLVAAGLTEVYTESFAGQAEVAILGFDQTQLDVLANPVNRDFAFCRPSIIPNLIKLLALNSWADDAMVFEIANVFPRDMLEETVVAIAAYGKQQKKLAELVPNEAISLIEIEHPLAKHFKLRRPVTVAQVPVSQLLANHVPNYKTDLTKPKYRPVSALPPAVRDISLIVDTSIDPQTLITTVYDIASEHVVLVELFDQFQSDKFGPNKQSLAFHVVYQSVDKTLDTAQVDSIHQSVIEKLKQEYNAEIR